MSLSGWLKRRLGKGEQGSHRSDRKRRLRRERRLGAVGLEPLEPRMLLAFEPLGSLIYEDLRTAGFSASPETDSITIELDANQTLAGVVLPDPGVRTSLMVTGPHSFSLGPIEAAGSGVPVGFQAVPIAAAAGSTPCRCSATQISMRSRTETSGRRRTSR